MNNTPSPPSARQIALDVLVAVLDKGRWAAPELDHALGRGTLSQRDAALATQLVYGTLRRLAAIDAVLSPLVRRGLPATDSLIRAALRLGTFQLLGLDRIPAHAAVSESVALVRDSRGPKAAGFANAVLRLVAAERGTRTLGLDPLAPWLARALSQFLEPEARTQLAAADEAPLTLRVSDPAERDAIAASIRAAHPAASVELSTAVATALRTHGLGDPRALPAYASGAISVQGEASQATVQLLGARRGERIADLCAGHGGKSWALATVVGPEGEVHAFEISATKLSALRRERPRLGLTNLSTHQADLSAPLAAEHHGRYDRVLVDAPCTGLGTLGRRPEIRLRVGPRDPARMAKLQGQILANAAALPRAGGNLVYAVCSPHPTEGLEVARAFSAAHPEFEPLAGSAAGFRPLRKGVFCLGPWIAPGMDAFQLIRWRRRP